MPENPIYNPNNIVRKEPVPVYNPNNIVKKEVIDTRVFSEDPNVKMPEYTTPKELEIDNAINFIDKQAIESGRVALTEERKGVLKDVLKNPNATKEQKEQAMLTVQGYDKDTSGDVSNKFYMQQDVNGVYVPKLLKHGQRPPKGTAINSFHGTQADANDDTWYTDLSKSLANGLVEAAGGVVDLAQAGQQLITGEESEILNDARNSVDFFKFKKDEDLNKSIYNTEGITKWADLLDKDRIDLTPSALWGTFNGLTESLSEFGFGTMVGGSLIKGAKGAKYALQGVDKAVELGSAAQKSAIVFGSTIAQLGDVMEAGKEAGLKGRDLPAFALTTATAMGTIDAMTGLEGKVMSDLFKKSKSQILKNAIKTVERDAAGNITPEAFKELAKRTSIQYGEMARNAGKEIVKDAIGEGTQEAVQDFTQKAAENLWDKMTDDERGQFGTDAFDAKSFGSYLNSFATGAISGVPMAIQQQAFKKRNEEQSIHVYDRVKQGEEGIKALRVDLNEALANNDISQSEYEQANFKIDKYQQYHELTSKYNIDPKDEKRAFELSFQIEGMKTEIPTDENLISKMKPLERSDVEADQSQVKTLQKELNEIILRAKVKGEPTVGKKTEETIIKEKEKAVTEEVSKVEGVLKEQQSNAKLRQKENKKESDIEGLGKEKVIAYPKLENKPYWKDDKRTYEEIDTEEFNNPSTDARTIHRVVRKEAYNKPNRKLFGNLTKRLYSYVNDNGDKMKGDVIEVTMEDGKKIRVASSKQEFKDENDKIVRWDDIFRRHFRSERTQGNEEGLPVGIRAVDLNNPFNEDKGKDYKPGKIALKVFDARTGKFLSWAKETKTGSAESLDKLDNELYTAEQKDLLKTLEQQDYNETPEGGDVIERLTKPKPKPTPTEKAKVATDKIVEEAKAKVKEQKASVPLTITKAVRQQLYDLGFTKANVDNMKPERALDIINKQEVNKRGTSQSNKNNPVNGVEAVVFSNPNLSIEGFNIDGNSWNVVTSTDRAKTLVNINGTIVPFYLTTGQAGKGLVPGWYPFFGIGKDGWLNKTDKSDMETYYERYWGNEAASVIKSISEELNSFYGTDPSVFKNDGYPNAKSRPLTTLADKVEDYINSKLSYTPAINDANARKTLRENVEKLGKEIINANKQETNKKEDGPEKESTEKEPTAKKDSTSLRRKIVGYNQLSKEQKKSDFGVNLRKEIQKEVEDFGGSLKPISGNKIQLLDGDGKQVKQVSVKRDQSVIDEEKAIAVKKKNALNTTPTSISQYLAMVIGAKGQFAESVTKEIPNVPSMMKDFKKGYTLESLLQGYKDRANLNDEAVNESDFNLEAMDFLKEYLIEGGRDLAIKYAVESYEKEINDGYTDKQIKELEAFAKENEIKESDIEKAKEIAQNVTVEEYKEITQKIESKNENERNEQLAEQIFEDYFGDENGINDVFIKDESKKSGEEKDISKNEYPDDVFQKPAELQYAEGQLKKAEIELTASKKALDAKRKELDKGIIDDREDLFGERKSTDATSLFDERVDLNAREETLAPFKQRYENAQKDFAKQTAKVKELQDKGDSQTSLFQKKAANKANVDKVIAKLQNAMPKVKIVFDDNLEAAGKWSPSNNTITVNPYYAGLDTPIHEAGHVLIDAMGYDNKVIQTAIKQLRGTDLYKETKSRYPELSEHGLDMEVLAEAIGREGADVFNKEADKSKFKGYLEYIFDWLKRKLGLEKNVAKNLAKQIIKGIGTKNLEGTKTGKEQLSKKSKNPLGAKPLRFEQYAAEHGFSYEKETEKLNDASAVLEDAQYEYDLAKEDAEDATTDAEAEKAEAILKEKEVELSKAKKEFAKVGKRTFEYKKYRKDFNAIQKIMAEKEVSDYSTEELQDLISMLHGFDNKAAKAVRQDAMTKLAMIATKKQQEKFKKNEGYIEDLAKTKDISPLQARILHHSHFTENNPDMQAVSLEFGNAVMDKILDANSKKTTHEKLGQKVIAEENKRLGIVGATKNRFSSDSAKYFDWMENENGELLTVEEAKAKGLSEAKVNYLKFTRETIADYKGQLEENDFENAVMDAIRIDKGFMEAYKSEGLLPAFSYYLGGGANNLGKVRILHNGKIMSYAEIEKEILSTANRKSVTSMAKALWDLLVANIQARRQLKKGFNIDEAVNPLELKGEAEYSLNEKGQLVSKFDKPRAKDRGYSKDFYKAMNQFIDESAHVKHISKIMPLVDSVEYLNKNGYMEEGYAIKPNVSKWIEDWKKLHIFKEPHVNDPILDASIKAMRKLVASTTMWFNIPANVLNVFMGNYSNWRQENGKTVALGNKRLFGGNGKNRAYGLDIIKKYNVVNQDYDSNATMKYGAILSKLGTIGTQIGEYQIQGSLGLGLLSEDEFNSFEYTKDKYGNEILTVKPGVDEKALKEKMTKVKNRVTDIQGKYPDEDRRNIMKGEIGKAAFQFKVWIPDYFKERFSSKYYNAYGQEKEGTFTKLLRVGIKEMYADLKKGDFKNIYKNNPSFMSNLKGIATIGTLMALAHQDGDDEEAKKGSLSFQNALSQVLFILDLEQDKYMVSNPVAALGKTKDLLSAFEALVTLDEKAYDKVKRVLPANKLEKIVDFGKKVVE